MGNNHGKKVLTDVDMEFLAEHTSITKNDLAMYENFLLNHPDGTISRKEFRLTTNISKRRVCTCSKNQYNIILSLSFSRN